MYMASIDIKDAYYCVPVHEDYRKYLKFVWNDKLFQFTCLPNGLSVPRKYTKMMKPVYATLRTQGHNVTGFLDGMLLVNENEAELRESVSHVLKLLQNLGFVVNFEKSVLEPQTKIMHLGMQIDSITMLVTLPQEKIDHILP